MHVPQRMFMAFVVLACMASAGLGQNVVINEIHYNPAGSGDTEEFIELYNAGITTVDLTGWAISQGVTLNPFPPSTQMAAGTYLVVAVNPAALQTATGYAGAIPWTSGSLDNGGETVTIVNSSLAVVDTVAYDDVNPWPIAPDGAGPSLELMHPTQDNTLAASWGASLGNNGTPGAQNSIFASGPTIASEVPVRQTAVATLPTVSVTFGQSVTGVAAANLTINGSAATLVSGSGVGPYVFSGYSAPAAGSVTIALASGAIQSGGIPFGGASWTVAVGLQIVINELHYHPNEALYPAQEVEFVELVNAGAASVNLAGWTISSGLTYTFPSPTIVGAGQFLVVAVNSAALQTATGYAGALQWTAGNLSNGGERVAISDAASNLIDEVSYADAGEWPTAPDGDGPSLELINPAYPNHLGPAWRASTGQNGTPGAQNSVFAAQLAPIIVNVHHAPPIPAALQTIVVTASVVDDTPGPTVTLHYRLDQDPTIAYSSTPMFDDGAHGDGAAGDNVYGASVPGLADGQRLDFTIRASDGTNVAAAPAGHNTLVAGQYPTQTYLCKYSNAVPATDILTFHLITTQRTASLQVAHDETEYDGTFIRCDLASNCEVFYNVVERYRGQSSLGQHPHSFRINFPADHLLQSELGFEVSRLNLMSQSVDKMFLGYQMFDLAFSGSIPTPKRQFVRFNTNPLSHGGVQNYVYLNVERIDDDFLESQAGDVTPTRFPDRCSVSGTECGSDVDCPLGQTCVRTDNGNLYRGRLTGSLDYRGESEAAYSSSGYDKENNVEVNDWSDLVDVSRALDPTQTPDVNFETTMESVADADEWARWFAIHMLLVNQEGGIYRDTGDDYYIYFEPAASPGGYNTKFLAWDMDSVFGGFGGTFSQETIWRTTVPGPQRFLRSNAFAGRFVGAICDLLQTDFAQSVMNARIDALPSGVADAARKTAIKNWVAARHTFVNNEIETQTTIDNLPSSPYSAADPVIVLNGRLNQCGTHAVTVNGLPATFSVFNATWQRSVTLFPGANNIVVRALDEDGAEVDRAEGSVVYAPTGGTLDLNAPTRMVADKTFTLKATMLDPFGDVDWRQWTVVGSVTARRVSDLTAVPTTVTVFETNAGGVGGGGPAPGTIRFYNGVGSVSITLNDPASVAGQFIEVLVQANSLTASTIVEVLPNVPATFRNLSGTLTGANLTWNRTDGVVHLTGNVTVNSGSTLTIGAGTLVMVDQGASGNGTVVQVNGRILVQGTEAEPVFFFPTSGPAAMVLPQTVLNNPPSWRGIWHSGSGVSAYDWMFLTGAGNGPIDGHPRPPVMRFDSSHSAAMRDCVYADSPGKIMHVSGSGTFTVRRCLFSRVGIGGEYLGAGHTLVMEDCWYTRTGRASEPDGADGDAIHLDNSNSTQNLRRCILADSGDDGIDHNASNPVIEDTIIWNILDKAASLTGGSITFDNVLIFDCGTGIRGNGFTTQTTIAVGSPITVPNTVARTIIWSSSIDTCRNRCSGSDDACTTVAECVVPETCDPTGLTNAVNYTIVGSASDLDCGTGNLSSNPQFVSTGNRDYNLQAGSPALTAGPGGTRIGWLGFPDGQVCLIAADCNDGNVCTNDGCSNGTCVYVPIGGCVPCVTAADCVSQDPCVVGVCQANGTCGFGPGNNGASCSDGVACTIADQCAGGTCVGTPSCPSGQTCNITTGACEANPTTLTFQQGLSGYSGTADTYVQSAAPTANNGALEVLRWDTSDGSPAGPVYLLLRFDSIFGSGANQIPAGSTIVSASLGYTIGGDANATGNPGNLHESLVAWTEATNFNTFGPAAGVQTTDYSSTAIAATPGSPLGAQTLDVTGVVQAWSDNPASNLGWIVIPTGTDGVQVRSSEYTVLASERPRLVVEFLGDGCSTHVECDDGNPCTTDLCTVNGCVHDPLQGCCVSDADCQDGNTCTTNTCDLGLNVCDVANNSLPCDDGDGCTTGDTCAAGVCASGSALNCNDGNVCTADSCNPATGCVHTPTAGACNDGVSCTINDACSGGTCTGIDDCPANETCNLQTGQCDAQLVYEFQNGLAGYAGTHDTWLQGGAPTNVNGALEWLEWDNLDLSGQTFALVRFDSLFVGSGGPIPVGANILSATLTYTIGGPGTSPVGNGGQIHAVSSGVSWDESTATFDNFGGDAGVQTDEYAAAATAVAPGTPLGPIDLDVTSDVQAWAISPASNRGWVVVPTDNDGVELRSSEYTAVTSERPKLTVVVGTGGAQADPLPIVAGDEWRYFKGTAEPTPGDLTAWTRLSFVDDSWTAGTSGFGYGTDCDPYGTVLADMQNGYASIYTRRTFDIDDPDAVDTLTLTIDVDDGFVAYINGTRVAANNVAGTPPVFGQLATADHECSGSATPNPPQTFAIEGSFDLATLLQAGTNVLAVQAHNLTVDSSDFTLLAELSATLTTPCTTGADCSDGNLCTTDVCTVGVCSNPPVSCPVGQTCNPGTGLCESAPVVVTFQQGVGGYTNAKDTFVHAGGATANNAAATTLIVDGAPAADVRQVLLRFDGVFGGGAGQIPLGATIQSASLTVNITNISATGASLHRMLQTWNDTDNWNTWVTGIQANGVEAVTTADVSSLQNTLGTHTMNVTTSLAAWSAGAANHGWAWLPNGDDSWQFDSSEGTTAANRPRLSVTYVASSAPADPPTALAVGSRYLSVTPPAGQPSVALRVESASIACLPRYVDASGLLSDTPVFQSSAAWGTVFVGDREIIPSTAYQVRADVRAPLDPVNLSTPVSATTWLWGDTNNVDGVNLFDIICVLDGFQDSFANCTAQAVDLQDATPSRDVDLFDIVAVLDSFQSLPYPDGTPCAGFFAVAAAEEEPRSALTLYLRTATTTVSAGDTVIVDVFGDGADTLRGYQIALDATSRTPDAIAIGEVGVDDSRSDYVFGEQLAFPIGDRDGIRLANALPSDAVAMTGRAYLGSFEFVIGAKASGWLQVRVRPDETIALDADNLPLGVMVEGDLTLRVEGPRRSSKRTGR